MSSQSENYNLLQFTDACRTGVPAIDAEHQYLFDLINQVVTSLHSPECSSINLEEYVNLLNGYANQHFMHEEEYMVSIHDRELVHQQLCHEQFRNKMKAIDLHGLDEIEKHDLVVHLLAYTMEWLYRHILYSDILIGKIVHRADVVQKKLDEKSHQEVYIYCPFEEKLLTGIEAWDEMHREWFLELNEAYRIMEQEDEATRLDMAMSHLDNLDSLLNEGFLDEECGMSGHDFPNRRNHIGAHKMCLGRLHERDLAADEPDPMAYLEEMLDFLYAWLVNHITRVDKPAAEVILRQK